MTKVKLTELVNDSENKQKDYLEILNNLGFEINNIKEIIKLNSYIKITCKKGHSYESTYQKLLVSNGCKECYKLKPYFEIKYLLESEGYIVLNKSEDFKGSSKTKMEFKCKNNHIMISKCSHIRDGNRCKYCSYDKFRNDRKTDINEIKEIINKFNYEFIDFLGEYINRNSKILIKCENNHAYETSVNSIKQGCKCRKCYIINSKGSNSHQWKGGRRTLYHQLRNKVDKWREDSLIHGDYKCFITGDEKCLNLIVHHSYNFYKIIDESLKELNLNILPTVGDYKQNEILSIEELIIKKHYEYGHGILMREDIHILFHKIYGNKDNNLNQVLEFKNDYLEGKYNYI